MLNSLEKNYVKAFDTMQYEVYKFYSKYATEQGVTFEEASKALSRSELKSYLEQTKEYYDEIKKTGYAFDPAYKAKLHRILSLKSAVSRLEALQDNIQWEIEKLYTQQQRSFNDNLSATYEESYYKTIYNIQQGIGFSSPFSTLSTVAVNKAVATKWLGDNYSDRIWQSKDRLTLVLEQTIPQGIILGHSPRKIAKTIQDNLDTSFNNAVRLARTEFNKICSDAAHDGYIAAGVEQYKILSTLDHKTSDICGAMDGKIFNLSEYEAGVTANPFHPNCRTTTVAYFPPDEIDAMFQKAVRLAQDEFEKIHQVPADIDISRWKKGLTPLEDGKVIYVDTYAKG